MLHQLRRSLEGADLAHPRDVPPVPLHPELEVLVRVEPEGVHAELGHDRSPQATICPAICWILRTTNSAGLSGANPTMMLTTPRLMSVCVVVSRSHFTKYASRGDLPWNAPCRNSVCMNAPRLSRI